jgi:hypothetical protein
MPFDELLGKIGDNSIPLRRTSLRSLFLSALLLVLPAPLLADTVYTYTGNPLTQVFGTLTGTPYSTNDTISGWFSLPTAITQNTFSQVIPTAFNFTDGVTSYTNGLGSAIIYLATDSFGNIVTWYVDLLNDPSNDVEAITAHSLKISGDYIASVPYQLTLTNQNDPGTWSVSSTDPANSPVPEPSTLALMSTGLIGAFCTLRRSLLN